MGKVGGSVVQQAAKVTEDKSNTFTNRAEGWQELLKGWAKSGPVGLLVGAPFGSGYERVQENGLVAWAPHNYYVQLLLRSGLLGLTGFLLLLWRLWRHALRPSSVVSNFSSAHIGAITVAVVFYCIPYSPIFSNCVLVGAALSLVRRQPLVTDGVQASYKFGYGANSWLSHREIGSKVSKLGAAK
jgi:hypothetical protein